MIFVIRMERKKEEKKKELRKKSRAKDFIGKLACLEKHTLII